MVCFINQVSPRNVILEQIAAKSNHAKVLIDHVDNPNEAPKDVIFTLICDKLLSKECTDKGWILDGYPNNARTALDLENRGIVPNRLFWLSVDAETCIKRLVERKYDPVTGLETKFGDDSIVNPVDSEESVKRRLLDCKDLKKELVNAFGYKTSESSTGIIQDIIADGFDENSKERCKELVLGNLIKPIPIAAKTA